MNLPTDHPTDPRAIRAQIDETRHRMDHTIDALKERFTGRHLVDEALHFIRTQNQNGKMKNLTQKISSSADAAVHSVVDTVKANPLPAVLIGTGVAWYIYNQIRAQGTNGSVSGTDVPRDYSDESYDRDASDLGISNREGFGVGENLKEKAGQIKERSKEAFQTAGTKMHEMGEQVREKAHEMGDRARRGAAELGNRSRQLIEQNPLESGLVCLAIGLIGGLALPTSNRVRQTVAPGARRLRQRAGDMADRSRVVLRSATQAAKTEAEAQGLTRAGSAAGNGAPQRAGNPGGEAAVPESAVAGNLERVS